jgi:hypothetical protein
MGDSEKDGSRESTPIRDSVPVTSRILEMQPDAKILLRSKSKTCNIKNEWIGRPGQYLGSWANRFL